MKYFILRSGRWVRVNERVYLAWAGQKRVERRQS
jgi:hypothetical protein